MYNYFRQAFSTFFFVSCISVIAHKRHSPFKEAIKDISCPTSFPGSLFFPPSLSLQRAGRRETLGTRLRHVFYSGTSPLGHLYSGDITFGPGKMFIQSLYPLPLLKGHLYSGERDTFSGSRRPVLTSIQGHLNHSKRDWPQRGLIRLSVH